MSEFFLNSDYRTHIQHLKSKKQYDINHPESGVTSYSGITQYYDNGLYPSLPTVQDLAFGEIALNVAPGTETIAIKNYNGDIVFIPFNVAKKIQKLGQKVDDNYDILKNYTDKRISVLSGDTFARFDSLSDLLTALSGETTERLDDLEDKIDELSGYTHENIDILKNKVIDHDNILSGLTEQIEEVSQNVVEGTNDRLNELSAYTVSSFTQNAIEHDEIRDSIETGLGSLSGDLSSRLGIVSGTAENALESAQNALDDIERLSGYTSSGFTKNEEDHQSLKNDFDSKIGSLSGDLYSNLNIVSGHAETALEVALEASGNVETLTEYVEGEVERIDGDIAELGDRIDGTNSGLTKTIGTMNQSLGFLSGGTYVPTSENLKFKNVTQSLDYIDQKLDEDIISGETRYRDLIRIILEDEKVTANFAAIINNSCGFDINAIYRPTLEFLKGLNVTEAIDSVYNTVEADIDSKIDVAKSEMHSDIGSELNALSGSIIEYVDNADDELNERINWIEKWFSDAEKQYLVTTVTHNELVLLASMGMLKWGMLYRITNYQATVNKDDPNNENVSLRDENIYSSDPYASNGFEILVRATSNRTLNENAIAMYNPYYDAPINYEYPECWEIKYCAFNDDRATWTYGGEYDKGKGFIYYMKDQYGNEAPYDFKNIKIDGHYLFEDTEGNENSNSGLYRNNVIKPTYTEEGKLTLNNIHFQCENGAVGNEFKTGCKNITINGTFNNNTVSPVKNDTTLSNKENTFLGFNFE